MDLWWIPGVNLILLARQHTKLRWIGEPILREGSLWSQVIRVVVTNGLLSLLIAIVGLVLQILWR